MSASKYKSCPQCNHRNISYADKCDRCGADISNALITEIPLTESAFGEGNFLSFILFIFGAIWIVLGIIGLIATIAQAGWGALLLCFICFTVAVTLFALGAIINK